MSTSTSDQAHIIAIFSPKPDKVKEVRQLLDAQARSVHENEDYCLRFILTEQSNASDPNVPDFILFETYDNKEAVGKHGQEPHFKVCLHDSLPGGCQKE